MVNVSITIAFGSHRVLLLALSIIIIFLYYNFFDA